jgi:hypothetical protein
VDGEALESTREVAAALEKTGVAFHLGGPLASSIHGFPRATLDADIVADLTPGQGLALRGALGAGFYADTEAIEEAIRSRRSFNVIHLRNMFKVDVFVVKDTPFDRESFQRARPLDLGGKSLRVSTPEDTVLHKLFWFRKGDETSARQWGDVVGVLKVQGDRLDFAYVTRWAEHLGLVDLLQRACGEAGLATPEEGAK